MTARGLRLLAPALGALVLGCAARAALPPPRMPLTPTPAVAGPPGELPAAPPAPIVCAQHTLPSGIRVAIAPTGARGLVGVTLVLGAAGRWDAGAPESLTGAMGDLLLRATLREDGAIAEQLLVTEGFAPTVDLTPEGLFVSDRVLAEEVPRYLALLDRAVRYPAYRARDVELHVAGQIERWEGHRLSADGALEDALVAMLYRAEDPRSLPVSARVEALRAATPEALSMRHRAILDPTRTVLVLTGDVRHEAVATLLAAHFGAWEPSPSAREPAPARVREDDAPRGLALVSPLVRSYVKLVERAPPLGHPDHAAFLVLEQLLGGMFGARLNLDLRERRGLSYGFHASYAASGEGGQLELVTAIDNRHTATAVRAMIDELRRVRGEMGQGIEPYELGLARTRAREALLASLDTVRGLAVSLARQLALGRAPESLLEVVAAIDALDSRAVEAAARRWIRPDRAPLAVVASREITEEVRALDIGGFRFEEPPERRRR